MKLPPKKLLVAVAAVAVPGGLLAAAAWWLWRRNRSPSDTIGPPGALTLPGPPQKPATPVDQGPSGIVVDPSRQPFGQIG